MARKGLWHNINKRKKAGTSRSKKDSTISAKAYANMKAGFPKKTGGFKRYAVGGLTNPTMYGNTPMYGANVIPGTDTASIVYQESDPNRLAELDQQIADTSVDPGYQITAAEELADDARKEAIATRVGSKAVNLAAKEGKAQYAESLQNLSPEELANLPETTEELMGDSAGGALRQGATAFKTTRDLNRIYQGTATAKQVGQASKSTTELLANLSSYGDTTLKTSSAVGSGISAVAKSAGPQLIAQAATYGLDKWYDKVSDDDTLEGQANFTSEEKALSGARGATAGVAALGTASWIAGLAGVSAANAWNPLGWAGLIAAGIGAGVTLLNRNRKAKKAGEAVGDAEESRQRDLANLRRGRQVEALRDKQYSGFDYGGDVIMPGQYRHGGIRPSMYGMGGVQKYQTMGVLGYDDDTNVEYDEFGLPINQNFGYLGETLASDNTNVAMPGFDANPIQLINQATGLPYGGAPVPEGGINSISSPAERTAAANALAKEAGAVADPVSTVDITQMEGYDTFKASMDKQDAILAEMQAIEEGYQSRLEEQYPGENVYSQQHFTDENWNKLNNQLPKFDRDANEALGMGGYPLTNRFQVSVPRHMDSMGNEIFSGAIQPMEGFNDPIFNLALMGAPSMTMNTLRGTAQAGGNVVKNATSTLLNRARTNFGNMIYNPSNASWVSRTGEGLKGLYNAYGGTVGVPKALMGLGAGSWDYLTGQADTGTGVGMLEDVANLGTGNVGGWTRALKAGDNITVKEGIKIAEDIEGGDYLSALMRGGVSLFPDDQSEWGEVAESGTKLVNKYLGKEDSDAFFESIGQGRDWLGENAGSMSKTLGNVFNPFSWGSGLTGGNVRTGFGGPAATSNLKAGGMRSLPGGKAVNIGNGATKYIGQTHAQGGIMADPQSEVENNEVEKNVTLADGSTNPYIYSEYLNMDGSKGYKTGGMSIADKAEELARTGAPQSSFDALAIQQEKAAGRDGSRIQGTGMAKKGGFISKYQTQGLMISNEYPRDWYDSIYSEDPTYDGTPLGKKRLWYTPDGAQHISEADAVDYINRGEMKDWKEGDPSKRKLTSQELFDSVFDEFGMFNPDALRDPRDANEYGLLYPGTEETDTDKTTTSTTQGGTTQGGGKTYVSPFDNIEEERAFQDFANEQGVDTGGYGWGRKSDAAWNQLLGQWEAKDAEVVDDAPAPKTDKKKNPHPVGSLEWHNWEKGITAAAKYNNDGTIDYDGDPRTSNDVDLLGITDEIGTETGSDVTDDIEETRKEKRQRLAKEANDNGTLLKAAQFIPAIMAFNDKADTMDPAERIGGVPRVHLDRVDMSDQIAANNAQGRAVQRFIDNAGMGTAGFAARMANYAQNQGLNMAVQAEQARMNTEIQNSEATANMEVEARNRQIAENNRQARMLVDQFNTESEAATKAQRVSAVQNAASGLLTQWMDKQMLDSQERVANAVAGQTGIMQREAITNYLANAYPDLEAGTDAYNAMFTQAHTNMYGNTTNTKKFGGMRNIPRLSLIHI